MDCRIKPGNDEIAAGRIGRSFRRREFITLLGGAAASLLAWPLPGRAQKAERMRRLGVLMGTAESDPLGQQRIAALRAGLQELGWKEGGNLAIELRWTGSDPARLKDYTAELIQLAPDVIVSNGTPATQAIVQATRTIPIVFAVVNDPVEQGFIANLAHPGGNVTGFSFVDFTLFGKSLELLRDIAPKVTRVGLMYRPADHPYYDDYLKAFAAEKQILPTAVTRAVAGSDAEIENQIANLAAAPGGGLIVAPDTFTLSHRQTILASVAQHGIPTIHAYRESVVEGGLMSYAPDSVDIFNRAAAYVDRILKGEKPADLPAQAPVKFEFVVNLKTAKVLGLDMPPTLLALADGVIE
jgi:putative ABC transport system substrate-binding protein